MDIIGKKIQLVFIDMSDYKYIGYLMPVVAEDIKQKIARYLMREPYAQGFLFTTKDLIKNIELL